MQHTPGKYTAHAHAADDTAELVRHRVLATMPQNVTAKLISHYAQSGKDRITPEILDLVTLWSPDYEILDP